MEKLKSGKIKIIGRQDGNISNQTTVSKRPSFFRFSTSAPSNAPAGNPKSSLKEPLFKGVHLSKTSGRLAAIEKWVDLEEKIVHDYQSRRPVSAKPTPPLSMASTVSYASVMPALKKSSPGSRTFLRGSTVLWASGWVLAALFLFFYVQGFPVRQDASLRVAKILDEKARLEQSYAEVKTVSEDQRVKLEQLNLQIQKMAGELQLFRARSGDNDLLRKTYRQELMRITTDYEIQLDTLRAFIRSRDEIIVSLRAQMQAFETLIDQGRLSAVSGMASRAMQQEPFSGREPSFQNGEELFRGQVTLINRPEGFFSINIGYESGVRSGQAVQIYREGVLIGEGVVDRVYPTMSSVTTASPRAFSAVREGDFVLF